MAGGGAAAAASAAVALYFYNMLQLSLLDHSKCHHNSWFGIARDVNISDIGRDFYSIAANTDASTSFNAIFGATGSHAHHLEDRNAASNFVPAVWTSENASCQSFAGIALFSS